MSVFQERNFVGQAIELIDLQVARVPPEQRMNAYRDHVKFFLKILRDLQETHDEQRAILGEAFKPGVGSQ
ncbi:MAG: hypothetical protein V3S24_08070 [Candidatus Tectomicrobia bacterium]